MFLTIQNKDAISVITDSLFPYKATYFRRTAIETLRAEILFWKPELSK
jgi:hypothetical protein